MKTNGCGACNGFWKWLKPPHHHFFVEECNIHDIAYNIGGNENDRKKADRKLFFAMIEKSISYYNDRKITSLWWLITISLLYYYAVRRFGKRNFNYTSSQ